MNDYSLLTNQVKGIVDPSLPLVTNLANVSAILNQMDDINSFRENKKKTKIYKLNNIFDKIEEKKRIFR